MACILKLHIYYIFIVYFSYMFISTLCTRKQLPYNGSLLWEEIFENQTILYTEVGFNFC